MILETADLASIPGHEAAVREAATPLFLGLRGCWGVRLHRVGQAPGNYCLLVDREPLEDHTVHFRGSDAFAQWRALASSHVAAPPMVTHSEEVLSSEGG